MVNVYEPYRDVVELEGTSAVRRRGRTGGQRHRNANSSDGVNCDHARDRAYDRRSDDWVDSLVTSSDCHERCEGQVLKTLSPPRNSCEIQ